MKCRHVWEIITQFWHRAKLYLMWIRRCPCYLIMVPNISMQTSRRKVWGHTKSMLKLVIKHKYPILTQSQMVFNPDHARFSRKKKWNTIFVPWGWILVHLYCHIDVLIILLLYKTNSGASLIILIIKIIKIGSVKRDVLKFINMYFKLVHLHIRLYI